MVNKVRYPTVASRSLLVLGTASATKKVDIYCILTVAQPFIWVPST